MYPINIKALDLDYLPFGGTNGRTSQSFSLTKAITDFYSLLGLGTFGPALQKYLLK